MGIYEDVMASLTSGAGAVGDYITSGRAEQDFLSNTAMGRFDAWQRAKQQLDDFARSQGYAQGSMDPSFRRDFPDEVASVDGMHPANGVGLSIGAGAMGAAARASANAAPAAPRPAQPMLPGLGSAAVPQPPKPAAPPPPSFSAGVNPNAPAPNVPQQGTLPGFGPQTPPPPPSSGGTPQQPPLPGFNPIAPTAGAPTPPTMTPGVNPNAPAPRPPAPNPNQPFLPGFGPSPATSGGGGMLSRAAAAAQSNPIAAGVAALGTGLGIGIGAAALNRPPSTASSGGSAMPGGYEQPLMPGRQEIHDDQVERERQEDYVRRRREAQLQTEALEAANAYANAQRAELERRLANADMTDSQKEAARSALERELASIREGGANQRNEADIQSRERITGMTEAGANERNRATIESNERQTGMREAGEDRRTGIREAGENTRTTFRGGVEMRGQDQRAREAQDNFVTQTIANNVAAGRLSVDKANKMIADYVSMAKLPTDILKQVSDSIQPFLPYMRNGNPGDIPAGFEKGGARDALAKLAGVKTSSQRAGYSDFNLMDVAAQYGGGPPAAPPKPLDVQGIYGAIPEVNTNTDAYRGMSASSTQLARPTLGGGEQPPPMVQNLMPQTVTPPMGEDVQQRILAGLGQ